MEFTTVGNLKMKNTATNNMTELATLTSFTVMESDKGIFKNG